MYVPNKRADTSASTTNTATRMETVEENRDPRRFNSLEEAEQFAKDMRRTNRIYAELCAENTEEVA